MRCYLVAEVPTDLTSLRQALAGLGVEVVEAGNAFDSTSPIRLGWLPAVDFVCAVFSSESGWQTPPSVYLELGQAVGAGLPTLIIAEPPRKLDPALSPIPIVRISLANRAALSNHISLFLQSVGQPHAAAPPPRNIEAVTLDSLQNDLAELREVSNPWLPEMARRLEGIVLRLFTAAGAEVQEAARDEGIGDFAAWVPGTERFIPSPLLVEVKLLTRPYVERSVLDQLQLFALNRDATWSLLLYYVLPGGPVHWPAGANWPQVLTFNIEELVARLRGQSLAQVLNNERNSIVHGIGRG